MRVFTVAVLDGTQFNIWKHLRAMLLTRAETS